MTIRNSLTELLNIEHPIVLAAMDLVADARLACAVSQAGGFGFLGAGYGDEAWLERELAILAKEDMERRLSIGVGFITWSLAKKPWLLERALAIKPRAIWLSFGDPEPFVRSIKDAGVLLVCQVQSVAMAADAVSKGADVIVAQGGEAGGHGISQGAFTLAPAIVDAVGDRVPVLLAGGAADGRGLAAAVTLGTQGIVVGTRFYASQEAAGSQSAKQRIVAARGDETLRSIVFDISRKNIWPHPFTGRCLKNAHLDRWSGLESELMQREDVLNAFESARCVDDFDTAPVIAGEACELIHEILSAGEIVHRTVRDAERILTNVGCQVQMQEYQEH